MNKMPMNKMIVITKREFAAYFTSPIAYVYLVTFLVLINWFFFRSFFVMQQVELRAFFDLMPWLFLFFIPAVAMGKWAEEKKEGTIELLLTLPVRDSHVVLGKFLAAFGLIATAILMTAPIPITASSLGNLDWGPVIGGYLGLLLLGASYLSIGLFISAITENQIIAFIVGVVVCFALFILGEPIVITAIPDFLVGIFRYLALGTHFDSIGRGVVDSRDILYYFSVIGLFLWCNLKAIEMRHAS